MEQQPQTQVLKSTSKRRAKLEPGPQVERRAADVLLDQLETLGVNVIFGIPGGATVPIFDALLDRPNLRSVVTRHESHAMFASAGYARSSGKLGVVVVTSGPGVLNTMNGLGSIYTDGLPVLVLAGEAARRGFGKGAVQEGSSYALNVVGMASHVTKLAIEVAEPSAIPTAVRKAAALALSGRPGPVLLSLPLDVISAPIVSTTVAALPEMRPDIPEAVLRTASASLQSGGRKLIFAGSGVSARAATMLIELAERLQCPVVTTPKAKGTFPENHRLALGVFGMGGHRSAREYAARGLDTLLVLGSSLNEVATDGWSEDLCARELVHVDIDVARIGRVYRTTLAVEARVEEFLRALIPRLSARPNNKRFGVRWDRDPRHSGPRICAPRALWELQEVLPSDTIYTGDSGSNLFFATHYLRLERPGCFIAMLGLGSMGSSIGAAIGVALARPRRVVAALCGDGGFAMSVTEIATASSLGIPLVVVVLDDQRLGMVEFGHAAIMGRTPRFPTGPFDVSACARACGANALRVDAPGEILNANIMERLDDRPVVIHVRFDTSVTLPKNKRFQTIRSVASTDMAREQ